MTFALPPEGVPSPSSSSSPPNFSKQPEIASKTGKTESRTEVDSSIPLISNQAFLSTVFQGLPDQWRPIVVGFSGNPAKVTAAAWRGHAWESSSSFDSRLVNAYFSLAAFTADREGIYRRRKAQFAALFAILLDDVGTKVPMARLRAAPSWLIETSAGNYQAGYLLDSPIDDVRVADRLMESIIAAGLSDPGAGGPAARLARLPVGVNGKHMPPFACRLLTWEPQRRYSVTDLIAQLGLNDPIQPQSPSLPPPRLRLSVQDHEAVWTPAPVDNAVLVALRERGLIKAPLSDGRHDISCPWKEAHTGGVDHGTAYFEPSERYPLGGFKCQHGHCAQRSIRDLLDFLQVPAVQARMQATIRTIPGELHRIVDAAERELARIGGHYQRGRMIVALQCDPADQSWRIQPASPPALMKSLAAAARWERFDQRSQDWVRIDPPARIATVLHEQGSYTHLPVLTGIARQPYLRPDGSLVNVSGYDAATGMYGAFDAAGYAIATDPTESDARAALAMLDGLLDEFCFAAPADRSAALCAMLTAAVRPSLPTAPMFHVRAPMPGSGKSYLCELISVFAMPERPAPMAFPSDDEECRKLLLAELLRSPAVIEFDNLTSDLMPHKSLCTALTSGALSGRILGVSKTASVTTRVMFLSSGNNVVPIGDMARRCVTVRLSPQVEQPAARSFSRPALIEEVRRMRAGFMSAAITIVRAGISANLNGDLLRSLASFDHWSDWCRLPIVWLGLPDPIESVFDALAEDPGREALARLMRSWDEAFAGSPTRVKTVAERCGWSSELNAELKEAVLDVAGERGEVNRRRLGWYLRRHEGRIVDGMQFLRSDRSQSAELWQIKKIKNNRD